MKLDRCAALNLVAAMATLLCIVTSQVEATAITSNNSRTEETIHGHEPRLRVQREMGHRNRGLLSLLSELISQTRNETMSAINQISDLVTSRIVPVQEGIQLNNTSPASSRELPDGVTTTTPYTVSQQEVLRILRRNFRGFARLFNMESRKAIEDSNNNVRDLRKEFTNAVRPYFVNNSTTYGA